MAALIGLRNTGAMMEVERKRVIWTLALTYYSDPIAVIEQCLQLRERRNGVDRCLDEVQSSLHDEARTMRQGEAMLARTVQEATEQIRLLRSAKYQLDRDLTDKSKASEIDSTTSGMADCCVSDSRSPR